MRNARDGKERYVVRLMNRGDRDGAVAYMKKHGMVQAFSGAPEWKPVSAPEPASVTVLEAQSVVTDIPGDPNYKYPDFKPARDPVPEGVRYARISAEYANRIMKVIVFEDDGSIGRLFMGLQEQRDWIRRKGRLIGQTFPVEKNTNPQQEGFRIWKR